MDSSTDMMNRMLLLVLLCYAWMTRSVSGTPVGSISNSDPPVSLVLDPLDWIGDSWFLLPDPSKGGIYLETKQDEAGVVFDGNVLVARALRNRLPGLDSGVIQRVIVQVDDEEEEQEEEDTDTHSNTTVQENDAFTNNHTMGNASTTVAPTITTTSRTGDATNHSFLLEEDYSVGNETQSRLDANAPAADDESADAPGWSGAFGWMLSERPYSCYGADRISFWYRYTATQDEPDRRARFQLVLYDNPACLAEDCANVSEYIMADVKVGQADEETNNEWTEVVIRRNDNDSLDWNRIWGWKFVIDFHTDHSRLRLDHLACYGSGGQMLQAPFHAAPTYAQAVQQETWEETFFQSEVSELMSERYIDDAGALYLNYTVQMTQNWGGFVSVSHSTPANSYYNLSQANHILLDFNNSQAASIPDRLTLRLILLDSSNCLYDCGGSNPHENWYSFHSILNDVNEDGTLAVPFIGSDTAATPLWLTGWAGARGNALFDSDRISGFTFELSLDNVLDFGQLVHGVLTLAHLRAVVAPLEGGEKDPDAACVTETALFVNTDDHRDNYKIHQFLSNQCCQLCRDDPDCLYAIQDSDGDCSTASHLVPESVELLNQVSESRRNAFAVTYVNDPDRRGDYCTKCTCLPDEQLIDCRGRDLRILPRTFGADFVPLVLDVRDNPQMVLLGSLDDETLRDSLETLRLPANLRYLPPELLDDLVNLQSLEFENEDSRHITNAVSSGDEAFGDVCCVQSRSTKLPDSDNELSFCDLQYNAPGSDSVYFPYLQAWGSPSLKIYPSSDFLFEASESVETCAAYCAIIADCQFFAYDGRAGNAEPSCSLISTPHIIAEEVCCEPNHYGDSNQSTPGWTSGMPPRTRHTEFNASVHFHVSGAMTLEDANEFSTQYDVSLGAMPILGAVWVMPDIVSSSREYQASVYPPRVILYDNETVVTVTVKLSGVTQGSSAGTLVIQNTVSSCDRAFTSFGSTENAIYLNVVAPQSDSSTQRVAVVGVTLSLFLLAFGVAGIVYDRTRRSDDSVWKINSVDLEFSDPPEVVGRGTFGLVLLANYRGTMVAVKRVIPPQDPNRKGKKSNIAGSLANGKDVFSAPIVDEVSEPSSGGGAPADLENGVSKTMGAMSGASLNFRNPNDLGMASGGGLVNKSATNKTYANPFKSKVGTRTSSAVRYKQLKKEFVKEMKILARLRHPCITTVMGAVIDKNSEPMLVMEYMQHGSFYDILHNNTMPMGPDLVLPILADIIAGIQFLHLAEPPVLHGDLKAANILVDDKFRAKVSDFGLSQKKHLGGTGTPYWMAPELLRKESTNTSMTDIYSFGMIIYEAFSRKDPYEGEDFHQVLAQVADREVSKRPPAPKSCPAQIESIMADCMVDEPSLRPSATELTTRLQRVKVEEGKSNKNNGTSATVSLFDIFPQHVAEALRDGCPVEPEHKDCVTIFFSDIVGFTDISSTLEPRKVADMLDRLYHALDELSHQHDIFKVETIGDAYMAVTNLVKDQPDCHARRIAEFSIDAIQAANQTLIDTDDPDRGCVNIRVGFHSGPVVADVVGNRNPRYCLFGDTVNTASRMESNSKQNRIHCSKAAADLLRVQCPDMPLRSRGEIPIKGKGVMHTYWVNDNQKGRSRSVIMAANTTLLDWVAGSLRQHSADLDEWKDTEVKPMAQPAEPNTGMGIEESHPANQDDPAEFRLMKEQLHARLARNDSTNQQATTP